MEPASLPVIKEEPEERVRAKPKLERRRNFYGLDRHGNTLRRDLDVVEKEFFVDKSEQAEFIFDLQKNGWTIVKCYVVTVERVHIVATKRFEK